MHYQLFISEAARHQLRSLEKDVRRNIGFRIEALRQDLQGNVKKLEAANNRYRLRIGDFRVLFTLEGDAIAVYAVKNRKDAYE
jgi:mRNA interferase RelE/StbE